MLIKLIRFLLYPISLLYGGVVSFRNILYDKNIFKSTSFQRPIICIGNLSVGGTGKTPHTEYLIRLLKDKYTVATLSRGYGRKSKGYVLADEKATASTIGDEPLQFYSKFKKEISVAVNGDRVEGVQNLIKEVNPELILLDDAFQHRAIKAGFYILLTPFDDLLMDDFLLPTGNLREGKKGVKRADIVVVTKCHEDLIEDNKKLLISKLHKLHKVKVYFSKIEYDTKICGVKKLRFDEIFKQDLVLVTGIANPKPMVDYLKNKLVVSEHLKYSDHYDFTKKEALLIKEKAKGRLVLTTEKDYMRLKQFDFLKEQLYYLPIKIVIDESDDFDQAILEYVKIAI